MAANQPPLKIGYIVPISEGWVDDGTPAWRDVAATARHAEQAGFDSIWINDHLINESGDPNKPAYGGWESWSMVSAIAACVPRIDIGTFVTCVGFRNPALLAKMAVTVDEICGGRFILGLGAGYQKLEFRSFGFPFDNLMGRFEESLQIIRCLLQDGTVDFEGRFHRARGAELRPRGPRPGGPPIMIGAAPNRPRSLRLTAQYADYWNMFVVRDPAGYGEFRDPVDAACARVGRDPATLQRTVTLLIDLPGAPKQGPSFGMHIWRTSLLPISGTPEELATIIRRFGAAGVDHVQVWLEPNTMKGIDTFRPVLELLDRG